MAMTIGGADVETVLFPALAATGGGVIDVPAAVSTGFFAMGASNVWFRGVGMQCSILRFVPGGPGPNTLIDGGGVAPYANTHFSDLCLDGNSDPQLAALIRAPGYGTDRWTFERVWFRNFPIGFAAEQITGTRFVDCLFTNPGDMVGTGIVCVGGSVDFDVIGCEFNWLSMAWAIEASAVRNHRNRFQRNRVRQDYWGMKRFQDANATGSGAGVVYTASTLTDPAKNFAAIPFTAGRTIRVMEVLRAGATTNVANNTLLEDAGADFLTLAPKYGDIVRTATAWSMVTGTQLGAPTILQVDGWRDLVTFLPVAAPPVATAYTLYRITLGETELYLSATQIQTQRWRDLLGNTVLPPNGTLYEILGDRATGGINWEEFVFDSTIADNMHHGGWADQITSRGPRTLLTNNICLWGQDEGITCNGESSMIIGGQYSYNGASGIIVPNGDDITIIGAVCRDNFCENTSAPIGNCLQIEGNRNLIVGCSLKRVEAPNLLYGAYIRGGAQTTWCFDNNIQGTRFDVGGEAGIANAQVRGLFRSVLPMMASYSGTFTV